MKNIKLFIALAAVSMAFTACEDDKTPVYQEPTEFILNTPPLASQYYELAPGGTVELTCSQPNYGYSAITNYSIEVALTDNFTTDEDGNANYITIKAGTTARMSISASDLATAICQLNGINDYASYPEAGIPAEPIYIRALASLSGVESSAIHSNVIKLDQVKAYNPYSAGGRQIYLVGNPQGWNIEGDDCVLNETGVGTNVYIGAFEVSAGEQYFRFYTQLGDWGTGSIGSTSGENTEVTVTDTPLTIAALDGSEGCWFTDATWAGGYITFTVDLNDTENIKVTMQAGNHDTTGLDYIYLVGSCSAWSVSEANAEEIYANYKLYDWNKDGVYSNTFNVAKGAAEFRFYTQLGNWDEGSLGCQASDEPIDYTFTDGTFNGTFVEGKGSWNFPAWAGGNMKMVVDTNTNKVTFTAE